MEKMQWRGKPGEERVYLYDWLLIFWCVSVIQVCVSLFACLSAVLDDLVRGVGRGTGNLTIYFSPLEKLKNRDIHNLWIFQPASQRINNWSYITLGVLIAPYKIYEHCVCSPKTASLDLSCTTVFFFCKRLKNMFLGNIRLIWHRFLSTSLLILLIRTPKNRGAGYI